METLNTLKLSKYAGVIFFIFILLKLIPRTKLENRDVLISSLVLFALYLIAENVFISNAGCKVDKLDGSIGGIDLSQLTTSISQNINKVQAPQAIQAPQVPQVIQAPQAPQVPQAPQAPQVIQAPQASRLTYEQQHVDDIQKPKCTNCTTTPKRTTDEFGMESYVYKSDLTKYETSKTRESDGVIVNETAYTDYNILPVTPEDSKLYEYGYSFLPPEKWYPVPPNPPICVTEKKCPVCPVTTTGTPVDMKEWNDSRRITPGDVINIDYAKDKLNSGR